MSISTVRRLSATGTGWAVATPHEAASDAAANTLRRGGNAVDAALAAAAMLTVVYPNQCSVGGDLLALVGTPDGTVRFVNASGRAPSGVDVDAIAARHELMPVSGALPVTVPGVVGGWDELARTWGSLPLAAALADAEAAARDGVAVSAGLARDLVREEKLLAGDPGMREVFFADGRVLGAGAVLRQPRLADSLAAIASDGAAAMYDGPVGAAIVDALAAQGSAMTTRDFAAHRVGQSAAVSAGYGDVEYLSGGANSQGLFFLAGLRALDVLRDREGPIDPLGAHAGAVATILATTAGDRDRLLADPDFADVPAEWLLSDERARELADSALTAGARGELPPRRASGDTVAVVTADREGNWVSLIQSVFHAFGAALLEPRTGIVLHNRGASFSLAPESPNRLAGGKRPMHTLMPVLVRRDGRLVGAHGAMGGRAQPQVHTHVALHLDNGAALADAVSAPRWVLGSLEAGVPAGAGTVKVEDDVPEAAVRALRAAGLSVDTLTPRDDGTGHAQIIRAHAGSLGSATDPRADGAAAAG